MVEHFPKILACEEKPTTTTAQKVETGKWCRPHPAWYSKIACTWSSVLTGTGSVSGRLVAYKPSSLIFTALFWGSVQFCLSALQMGRTSPPTWSSSSVKKGSAAQISPSWVEMLWASSCMRYSLTHQLPLSCNVVTWSWRWVCFIFVCAEKCLCYIWLEIFHYELGHVSCLG